MFRNLIQFHSKKTLIIASVLLVMIIGLSATAAYLLKSKLTSTKNTPTSQEATGDGTTQTNGSSPSGGTSSSPNTAKDGDKKTSTDDKKTTTGTSGTSGGGGSTSSGGGSSGNSGGGTTSGGGTSSSGCDLPAFPDETCTGYAHTGVTLHACSLPLTQPTYDSCLFTGEVNVSADNVKVTRSKIVGYVSYRTIDGGSLRGLSLTDVEIDSTNYLGGATIGNNDYTCIRCNVHGGTRGFNVGYNVTIKDSYSHGWHSQNGDHITAIGSNGGAHNVIDHNNISCDILNDPTGYACSSGISVYGDDPPGNDDWVITNNLINSGSSYCMIIAGPPSKPYPFTNMVVTSNHFGNVGARARSLPDSMCTEYGPVNQPDGVHQWNSGTNNVWSGNVDSNGNSVGAPS